MVYDRHAETDALIGSRPGDELIIMQWNNLGKLKPSKPCVHCMKFIKKYGISNIYYHNDQLQLVKERIRRDH